MSRKTSKPQTAGVTEADPIQATHRGAGMNIVPAMALMEALVLGLALLGSDIDALSECVQRVDALRFNEADDWRADMIQALRDMVDPSSANYLQVFLGYDEAVAAMPAIHIEDDGGGENAGEAEIGNIIGRHYTLRNAVDPLNPRADVYGPNPRGLTPAVPLLDTEHICVEHLVTGVGQTSRMIVGCWHPAPERSLLIQAAARWALLRMQGHLEATGIHEVTWSEGSIRPSAEMEPRLSYVPIITVTLHWTLRATRSQQVPNRIMISMPTFTV